MASLNIRDVSEETHQALKRQATAEGLSLQRYLIRILDERARRPTVAEVVAAARRDVRGRGSRLSAEKIAESVRAGRVEAD